jgi:hypothetical protein
LAIYDDWSLHAYFERFKTVSLDSELNTLRECLLIRNEDYSDTPSKRYDIVNLNTAEYKLFKRKVEDDD